MDFVSSAKKEGCRSQKVADLRQFWDGQKEIKLLDPNLLACPERLDLLQQLIVSNAYVDFTQGLDIRLVTDDVVHKIKQLRLKMLHFAWDSLDNSETMESHFKTFRQAVEYDFRKLRVYVLSNYDTTSEQDLFRIYRLRELGYDPYLMIYNKWNAPKRLRQMQRWVNNKFIFRSCEKFEDYKP